MIIVAGHLEVAPEARDAYLQDCVQAVTLARAADGCHDFSLSADLLEPGRINVLEVWESEIDVERFRGSGPSGEQRQAILAASVVQYAVAGARRLA